MSTFPLSHVRGPWRLGLIAVAGAVLVSGCTAVGADSASGPRRDVPTEVAHTRLITSHSAAPDPVVPCGETCAVVPTPPVADATPAVAIPAAAPAAVLPGADLPVITIRAVGDASVLVNDGAPCSNLSAASLGRGELQVGRSGAVDEPLTVSFTTGGIASTNGDIEALVNEITIPAGAASASVWVTPTSGATAAPMHEHRADALTLSLADADAYDLGAGATAQIAVRVDLDLFGCTAVPSDSAS